MLSTRKLVKKDELITQIIGLYGHPIIRKQPAGVSPDSEKLS
jgi:hypothetical protein